MLRAPHTEEPTDWAKRYKANLGKLASGDVNKVSEVVRDLWRRDRERGLSAGEKRMLAKARQILVSELALAEKTNEDKAEALLDEVLTEETNEDKADFKKRLAITFGRRQHRARQITRPAAGLLAVAACLLPAADRPRHAEEYRSELWDLAQADAGRLGQLGYALRQLRSAPQTGWALRSPRRQGAAP